MVTVVIPAYNVEKWLPRAVQSVIDQTFRDWELLIVDDGSSDGTRAVADSAARGDARIRAIHTPNRGAALARAAGVAEARGELVTFVDADDTIEPHAIEWLLRYMIDEVSAVVGGINRRTDRGSFAVCGAYSGVISTAEFINGLLMDDFVPSLCGKMFRRQDLLDLGGVLDDEILLNEDLLMLVAALRKPGNLYIDTSELIYNYSYRSDSATSSATMSFSGWQKLVDGLSAYIDDNETFFLYKLRRLYDCCITRGAEFSRSHPAISGLIADSKKYYLESQDRRILRMLYSRQLRRFVASRHRRLTPPQEIIISVIMAAYNGAASIERAVRSVIGQRFRDWELIVVDDCSIDSTPDVVRSMAAVDSRIRLLRMSSNRGQGAARLRGIAAARGEFLAFIDQDDLMAPEALERLQERARHTEADIVVMGSQRMSRGGLLRLPLFSPPKFFTKPIYTTNELLPHLLRRSGFPCTQWDRLYRRAFIEDGRHVEESVGEDLIFNLRTMAHEGRMAWIDYQGYRWRIGGQSRGVYPQRWERDLAVYRRMLEVLAEEGMAGDETLRMSLDQGLVNDFLDKVACALRQEWRKGLRGFIDSALKCPELVGAMRNVGFEASHENVVGKGREWLRRHKRYYRALRLLEWF